MTVPKKQVLAAIVMLLALAGCGGSTGASDDEVNGRIERFIASDIRHMAIRAGIVGSLKVQRVSCVKVDRTHFTCRIRSTSNYGDVDSIADVIYDPKTEDAIYDIRP